MFQWKLNLNLTKAIYKRGSRAYWAGNEIILGFMKLQ